MNEEIKALWVAELRSGRRRQGRGQLRRDGEECCLGVLCDLAVAAGIGRWERSPDDERAEKITVTATDWGLGMLPLAVQDWAGLTRTDPVVRVKDEDGGDYTDRLSNLNDNGESFATIADLIEEQL